MSRLEITGRDYSIAFGIDTQLGPFVQIWDLPSYEQDEALIVIDSNGVHQTEEDKKRNNPATEFFLNRVRKQFEYYHEHIDRVHRPIIHNSIILDLAQVVGGFRDIRMEVGWIFTPDHPVRNLLDLKKR